MVFLRPFLNCTHMKNNFRGYKSWALVTGAASGMGRVYARRLALMGYNLALVDINGAKLDETADLVRTEVETSERVPAGSRKELRILNIVQDLSQMDAADMVCQQTEAAGCEVEVLVNNAGVM